MQRGEKIKNFLITFFLGEFGVHKFMEGRKSIGFLYLFTLGLFGIGWFIDSIKAFINIFSNTVNSSDSDLLEWQNLVIHTNSDKLVATKQQLEDASRMYVDGNMRILNDSIQLVYETATPEVFFKRFDMIIDCYNNLADLEKYYHTNLFPLIKLREFKEKEKQLLQDFIQRYWWKTVSDADKLKTESAKDKRKEKAKNTLLEYSDRFDQNILEYIYTLS